MGTINRALSKADAAILKVEKTVCCILVIVMSCIIFLQIICRFVKAPLVWSEELSRFMFIWLIYMSASFVIHYEKHLCVDILPIILPPKGQLVVKIISNILSMLFFIFVAYFGVSVIEKLIARPQVSAAMQVNMIWGYAAPYLCSVLAVIHYIKLIFEEFTELFSHKNSEEVDN